MKIWENPNKRKGLITTIAVHLAMLIVFLFFGLTYLDPKPEEGIAINLGFMDVGMNINPEPAQSTPESSTPPPTESSPVEETPVEDVVEDVATQDQVEAPAVNTSEEKPKVEEKPKEDKPKEEEKPQEEPVKDEKPSEEPAKEEVKEPEPPKPDSKVNSALSNLFENQNKQSVGDDQQEGVKGKPTGKPNSPNFSNPDGLGSQGEGYYLNGRKNLNAPKRYPCQAQGKVVVQIWVDPSGKTTRAEPGKRGSTTTDECLLKIAKESAMETQWSSDHSVSDLQVGYIVFVYSQN